MSRSLLSAKHAFGRFLLGLGALALLGCGLILFFGWLLCRPMQTTIGSAPSDLAAENVSFPSAPNTEVHGWWCAASPRRGAVLLLPGLRANRWSMVERSRFLRAAGYSVLLIDFQATGETRGAHLTFGWKEREDVRAALKFLRQDKKQTQVATIGSSLGGAAALLAAPLQTDALLLEAVYPDIETATRNRLRKYLGPLGASAAPLLLMQLQPRLGISAQQLRPLDHVSEVDCPVLIIGGSRDLNTTPAETQQFFAAAREPKELWMIEGAGHEDFHLFAGGEYEKRVLDFLARRLPLTR